jgi:hypothetical protein
MLLLSKSNEMMPVDIITAVQSLPGAPPLSSIAGEGVLRSDLLRLERSMESKSFNAECINLPVRTILENKSDELM